MYGNRTNKQMPDDITMMSKTFPKIGRSSLKVQSTRLPLEYRVPLISAYVTLMIKVFMFNRKKAWFFTCKLLSPGLDMHQ